MRRFGIPKGKSRRKKDLKAMKDRVQKRTEGRKAEIARDPVAAEKARLERVRKYTESLA